LRVLPFHSPFSLGSTTLFSEHSKEQPRSTSPY
jgi:hypothetical protein